MAGFVPHAVFAFVVRGAVGEVGFEGGGDEGPVFGVAEVAPRLTERGEFAAGVAEHPPPRVVVGALVGGEIPIPDAEFAGFDGVGEAFLAQADGGVAGAEIAGHRVEGGVEFGQLVGAAGGQRRSEPAGGKGLRDAHEGHGPAGDGARKIIPHARADHEGEQGERGGAPVERSDGGGLLRGEVGSGA